MTTNDNPPISPMVQQALTRLGYTSYSEYIADLEADHKALENNLEYQEERKLWIRR